MTEKSLMVPPVLAPTAPITWTKQEVDIIRDSLAKDLNEAQFRVFMASAKALNLNPLAKQICPVVYAGRMSMQTEIAGYRVIAQRTGNYAGRENERLFVRLADKTKLTVAHEEYDPDEHITIISGTVEVRFKDGRPNQKATALMKNYAKYFKNKNTGALELGDFWAKMPDHMILKCAEALALRIAFPGSYDGLYIREEMGQAAVDVEFKTVERGTLNPEDLKPGNPEDHVDVAATPGKSEERQSIIPDDEAAEYRLEEIASGVLPDDLVADNSRWLVCRTLILKALKVKSPTEVTDEAWAMLPTFLKSPAFQKELVAENLIPRKRG